MFTTIAWATDLSSAADGALSVATKMARGNAAKVVIIHVEELPVGRAVIEPNSNTAASAVLGQVARELHDQGIDATVMSSRLAAGDVAGEIVKLARRAGADVIVAGSRRRGRLARMLHGDVASRLLRSAPCPVLIVPVGQPAGRTADTRDHSAGAAAAA